MSFNPEEIKASVKEAKELKEAMVYMIKTGEHGSSEFSKLNSQLKLLKENLKTTAAGMNLFGKSTQALSVWNKKEIKRRPDEETERKVNDSMVDAFRQSLGIAKQIQQWFTLGGKDILSSFSIAYEIVKSIMELVKTIDFIGSLLSLIPGGGAVAALARASGGVVPGSGSGDTVPALLTPGEFVIRKSSVQRYGTGFFAMLNNGVMNSSLFNRYAGGGVVGGKQNQSVQVMIPEMKIKGNDIFITWQRASNINARRKK